MIILSLPIIKARTKSLGIVTWPIHLILSLQQNVGFSNNFNHIAVKLVALFF